MNTNLREELLTFKIIFRNPSFHILFWEDMAQAQRFLSFIMSTINFMHSHNSTNWYNQKLKWKICLWMCKRNCKIVILNNTIKLQYKVSLLTTKKMTLYPDCPCKLGEIFVFCLERKFLNVVLQAKTLKQSFHHMLL